MENPQPTLKKALEGVQLPIAGYRGSGLAWMVDILSGVLTGGNHAGKVKDPFDDFRTQNIDIYSVFKANLFSSNFTREFEIILKLSKIYLK